MRPVDVLFRLQYAKAFEVRSGFRLWLFVDGEGTILSELLVGSRDYAGWEELLANTLK